MKIHRFPVPRIASEAEQEWSSFLATRFGCQLDDFKLTPEKYMAYPTDTTRIELMDGSTVEFKYAFAVVSEELRAIAVFTEHCGHHVFPYHEAKVFQNGLLQFQQVA